MPHLRRGALTGSVTRHGSPHDRPPGHGPVAVEYLWNTFNPGRPSRPSLAGGTNFAIVGATSGTENYRSSSSSSSTRRRMRRSIRRRRCSSSGCFPRSRC